MKKYKLLTKKEEYGNLLFSYFFSFFHKIATRNVSACTAAKLSKVLNLLLSLRTKPCTCQNRKEICE